MITRVFRHQCSKLSYGTCILFGLTGAVLGQQMSERLVTCSDLERITDPVLISNVAVGGNPVQCGLFIKPPAVLQTVTAFQAPSDWLQQMTISLVNRTGKTIVFGSISIHFMDTGDCRSLPCAGANLTFGYRPAVDAYDGRTGKPLRAEHPEKPALDWKPGDTFVVHVSDYMDDIQARIANSGLPVTAMSKVNVYRGVFYFDDGMQWSLGRYSVPEPEHPGKFTALPATYFPGKRAHNWPPGYNQ